MNNLAQAHATYFCSPPKDLGVFQETQTLTPTPPKKKSVLGYQKHCMSAVHLFLMILHRAGSQKLSKYESGCSRCMHSGLDASQLRTLLNGKGQLIVVENFHLALKLPTDFSGVLKWSQLDLWCITYSYNAFEHRQQICKLQLLCLLLFL